MSTDAMAMETQSATRARRAWRLGVAIAVATSLLTVWTTLVRDDGNGLPFLMLVPAAATAAFAARFEPAGMARGMFGIGVMQALVGVAVATAPATARIAGESTRALAVCGVFAALWWAAAWCFRVAARARWGAP